MRPIIIDMDKMSDSTEVYNSRPNPFLTYFIYFVLLIILVGFGWMFFSKIDVVIKANGIFRSSTEATEISSEISGKVTKINVSEGKYVTKGETLITLDVSSIDKNLEDNKKIIKDIEERLDILKAYEKYLQGEENALDKYKNNKYYDEFESKKRLLELSIKNSKDDSIEITKSQQKSELNNINKQKYKINLEIEKLRMAQNNIRDGVNKFPESDSYYYSIVDRYLSNYKSTKLNYDNKTSELYKEKNNLENEIIEIENKIKELKDISNNSNTVKIEDAKTNSDNNPLETSQELEKNNISVDTKNYKNSILAIKTKISQIDRSISSIENEKNTSLNNLKVQQITSLEEQIKSLDNNHDSLDARQSLLNDQLNILDGKEKKDIKEISKLSEQKNVSAEILTYETKKKENEIRLGQYDLEKGKYYIKAKSTGYLSMHQDLKEGSFISQGSAIGEIIPNKTEGFYVDIYVENSDIGKVKDNQKIKLEIPAYPSSEYGYFTGKIKYISKDAKIDKNSGKSYYLVTAEMINKDKDKESKQNIEIKNGMAVQAKIVVREETVLKYVLKKIDLID